MVRRWLGAVANCDITGGESFHIWTSDLPLLSSLTCEWKVYYLERHCGGGGLPPRQEYLWSAVRSMFTIKEKSEMRIISGAIRSHESSGHQRKCPMDLHLFESGFRSDDMTLWTSGALLVKSFTEKEMRGEERRFSSGSSTAVSIVSTLFNEQRCRCDSRESVAELIWSNTPGWTFNSFTVSRAIWSLETSLICPSFSVWVDHCSFSWMWLQCVSSFEWIVCMDSELLCVASARMRI